MILSGLDKLSGLHPQLAAAVLELANRYDVKLISGYRSNEEQASLYAQGRDASGKVVGPVATYAKPGESAHNFGLAVDLETSPPTLEVRRALGSSGELLGLTWGGRWVDKFPPNGDIGHFELPKWRTLTGWALAAKQVPWWVWTAAVGAAFLAFGSKRG